MGDLKELNISDNLLSELPTDLSEFYLLENINLSGNKFKSEIKAAEFFGSLSTV